MLTGILLIILLIICDQVSKLVVVHKMTQGDSITIIKDFFYITSHRNTGGAWGIFSGQLWFLIIITIIALAIFAYLMKDFDLKNNMIYSISLILMVAGTIGNFIDRIFRGEVVDFLQFFIFKYNFPIFNIADICLTIGVILLAWTVIFGTNEGLWIKSN